MSDVIFFAVLGIFTGIATLILACEFYRNIVGTTAEKRIRSLKPLSNSRKQR